MVRIRWATQLGAIVLVNLGLVSLLKTGVVCPVFYCHACPAAAFACPIGSLQNFSAVGPFPYYAIGSLGLFGLLAGRMWCGWACPFGTIQDVVAGIRRRKEVRSLRVVAWPKYVVLGGTLIAAWLAADALFCKVCPAGSLFAAIPQRFVSPDLPFGAFFYVHIGTLVATVAAFFLFARFWCRYLCPLGGALGLFNRVSILRVRLNKDKCTECRKCLDMCPTAIQALDGIGASTDCIQCGKCIEACPSGAISITASLT